MADRDDISHQVSERRRQAEEIAFKKTAPSLDDLHMRSAEDIQRVFHELTVHQIELEMQNEELRNAQTQIEAGRDRFIELYDLAPVGYCTLSEKGLIMEANLTAVNLFCTVRGDLVKQPISRFILNEDQGIYYLHRKKLFETGEPQECELRMSKPDGALFWAYLTATAAQAEDGASVCRIVISDITERKQAEDNLRMAHEKLLTILDSIDSTVYVADLNTHEILFMNQKMITDFGGNKTGDICYSAFRKNSEPCQCCTNAQLIDKAGNPAGVCIWHDKNPVTGRYYINHDRAIAWTDGRLVRMQIATDITDLKKMEAQLQQALKMEAIGTLAGGIAHDFNNILGAILGYAEMAQEDSPAGSLLRQDIDQIVKAGHRAKELVKQILAFSRQAETEQLPLQSAIIIQEAIRMLRSTLPSTIDIKQNIDMDAGLILASPTQIHQIVMNLGTNAFHAMEESGGTLAISLEKKPLNAVDIVDKPGVQAGDFVQLSIGDTGPGIAPELWDKIFDPYFTTKEVGKGTGMGLAIIHGIVKSYGGWVSLNSRPGQGTVFQVLLPVMTGGLVEMKPEETVRFGNERILYIDDEPLLAEMGKSMLERLGYQVTVQTGSLEALTIFQNQPDKFDLVITDQTMPGMTGSDLARRILQIRPFMPIILCTGYSSIITEEKSKSLGIKGFAMKPLAMKSIAALIREVLAGDRLLSVKSNQ